MIDRLPRVTGLVDFECAARLGSFRLAGLELHKTAGAVSLQVKQAEQRLGFALFIRHPRQIELTGKGRELAVIVRAALRTLAAGITALQAEDAAVVLRVSTTHSLAMKWLAPRLHRFGLRYPDLDVRVEATDALASLADGSCDVAIRHLRADTAGLLFRDQLIPVFSPTLGASSLDAALRLPLLREGGSDLWLAFLSLNGRTALQPLFSRSYSHAGLLVQAAAAGHGTALAPYALAFQDLEDGRLVTCECEPLPSRYGYAPVASEAGGKADLGRHFTAWLKTETDEMMRSLDSRVRPGTT
ncbi:MAG: LysR substrate-binding domain-containing protein [Hyphomicrobiales bacterium]|nr:LysR substrate-binding domain-containing protein [Hyphomicrobiales bacterium]